MFRVVPWQSERYNPRHSVPFTSRKGCQPREGLKECCNEARRLLIARTFFSTRSRRVGLKETARLHLSSSLPIDMEQNSIENAWRTRTRSGWNGLFNHFHHFLVQILVKLSCIWGASLRDDGETIQGPLEKHSSGHCTNTSVCSGCFTSLMHASPLLCRPSKWLGKITHSKYHVNARRDCNQISDQIDLA